MPISVSAHDSSTPAGGSTYAVALGGQGLRILVQVKRTQCDSFQRGKA